LSATEARFVNDEQLQIPSVARVFVYRVVSSASPRTTVDVVKDDMQ